MMGEKSGLAALMEIQLRPLHGILVSVDELIQAHFAPYDEYIKANKE